MSKRARARSGNTGRAADSVEVISLLDDSEDDPDALAVEAQHAEPPQPAAKRPSKRLRRLADSATDRVANHTSAAAPTNATAAALPAASSGRQTRRRQAPAEEPAPQPAASQRPSKLRQATLPVAAAARGRSALPLQMLNVTRQRIAGGAAPTFSGDSQRSSQAPSPSQRSRLSQDPDYVASQGASQPSASQQPSRPQLRQLTLAPARLTSTGNGTSAAGNGGARSTAAGNGGSGGSRLLLGVGGSRRGGCGEGPDSADGPSPSGSQLPAGRGAATSTADPSITTRDGPHGPHASGSGSGLGPGLQPPPQPQPQAQPLAEMWHERYAPRSEEDLAAVLHRKKVTEVREWLEAQRGMLAQAAAAAAVAAGRSVGGAAAAGYAGVRPAGPSSTQHQSYPGHVSQQHGTQWQQQLPHQRSWQASGGGGGGGGGWAAGRARGCGVAVLSGPAGCGKSACVRVLAEATGFEVVEWTPPPPVLWSEYQYQRSAAGGGWDAGGGPPTSYQSKLDDFEQFVSRSKYPALPLAAAAAAAAPRLPGATQAGGGGSTTAPGDASGTARGAQQPASGPARPKLLLLEDLPHTHDPERRQRLAAALRDLVGCARGPVVLVATEVEGGGAGGGGGGGSGGGRGGGGDVGSMGGAKGLHKDILAALQTAGAVTISFNPVTANSIAKLLIRVAAAERLDLPPAAAVGLAEAADGDVRSALAALQMHAALQRAAARGAQAAAPVAAAAGRGKSGGGKKAAAGGGGGGKGKGPSETALLRAGRQQALSAGEVARLAAAQRDLGLPLFHALGKFLYNKRNAPLGAAAAADGDDSDGGGDGGPATAPTGRGGAAAGSGGGSKEREKDSVALRQLNAHALRTGRQWVIAAGLQVQLPKSLQRPPMRYDPEAIIQRCGLEAPRLLAFLHENYPGFVDGEAEGGVEDVACIAAYMSDSAMLCGLSRSATAATSFGGTSIWLEDSPAAANLSGSIAASVAARGLMYGNRRPAPPRFNPIRAPASTAIDQAAAANRAQLRSAACRLAAAPSAGTAGTAAAAGAAAGAGAAAFSGSAQELVGDVMPWLRALAQCSPRHALWLVGALPGSWSYYWNGAVTEGAFLPRVAALPPPAAAGGWGGAGGWAGGTGGVENRLGELDLEDDDPIEG